MMMQNSENDNFTAKAVQEEFNEVAQNDIIKDYKPVKE